MAERAERRKTRATERENKLANGCGPASRSLRPSTGTGHRAQPQKAAAKAAEAAAAQSPWFGGKRNVMDLFSPAHRPKSQAWPHRRGFALASGHGAGGIGGLAVGVKMAGGRCSARSRELQRRCRDELAKMAISARRRCEQSIASFAAVYGNQGVAEKLFDQSVRIAKLTKFDTPEVVDVMNN